MASRGLFATGVSTDLNGESPDSKFTLLETHPAVVTYISSGGKIGDKILAVRSYLLSRPNQMACADSLI